MQKTYNAPLKMWALDCDNNHILHKIGSDDYTIRRRMMVKPEDVDLYEEVALEDIPPYTEAEYKAKVSELIHERYSIDDELPPSMPPIRLTARSARHVQRSC